MAAPCTESKVSLCGSERTNSIVCRSAVEEETAKREEEWYDWMETSEAHRVDEQIERSELTQSGVENEYAKWCEEGGLRSSQID